jgi:predicted site-specific integrase-resolvase
VDTLMLVRLKEAAKHLGVHPDTLRRWANSNKVKVAGLTQGKQRLFDLCELENLLRSPSNKIVSKEKITIAYARVSSHDQKEDLKRQIKQLELFCSAHGWSYELISDLGSGINYKKRGLKELLKKICYGEVERLVITHKDRLLRFGSELIFSLCSMTSCEVVIINAADESSFEEDLTRDVLEIITVFSARLYGARSHKNKKIMQKLKEVADEVCQ